MERLVVLCEVVGRYGGTERYWETVLPQLAKRYDVRLFARRVEECERFGVPATQIPWAHENEVPNAEAAERVARELSAADPAAVVTASVFDPLVLQTVRAHARRWIARIHDYRAFCPNGNKVFPQFQTVCTLPMGAACGVNAVLRGCVCGPRAESLRRLQTRMAVRDAIAQADAVLVSSRYMQRTCVQNAIPQERIHITPPPLPDSAYGSAPMPQSRDVLFSGRFNDQKGLQSLIRAIGRIDAEHRPGLIVAGAGDEREEQRARALAQRHAVAVRWLGWLPPAQVQAAIDAARVVAVPSLWPEPFGLTGTEAQARGRPVVAYDVGGVEDWIAGAGIAVARNDEGALARAIAGLIADDDVWERYARAARTRAEEYRLSRHLDALDRILAINAAQGAPS